MINYQSGGVWYVLNLCCCNGSVFPKAAIPAIPAVVLAFLLTHLKNRGDLSFLERGDSVLEETQAWGGFSFLVGFLIVFRTSQAYNRFWDGCTATHQMRAEWFDACSALVSFCRHSKVDEISIMRFKNTLVRLFSMLHVSALAELEEINSEGKSPETIKAYGYELLDARGIDEHSLHTIQQSHSKVELIFEWIQLLIVENIETGVMSIPPPILSRAFQEIANGMVAFHDALKMTYIPFPFPYDQACNCCLLLHWIITPFVMSQWVLHPPWAAVFVGVQVFILWSLNFIAVEIENPFGTDSNDLDGEHMQREMNRNLMLLLQADTTRTPTLAPRVSHIHDGTGFIQVGMDASFLDVWKSLPPRAPDIGGAHSATESEVAAWHDIATSARKGEKFIKALKHAEDNKREGKRRGGADPQISESSSLEQWSAFQAHPSRESMTSVASQHGAALGTSVPNPARDRPNSQEEPRMSVPAERLDLTGGWEAVGPLGAHGASASANEPGRQKQTVSFSQQSSCSQRGENNEAKFGKPECVVSLGEQDPIATVLDPSLHAQRHSLDQAATLGAAREFSDAEVTAAEAAEGQRSARNSDQAVTLVVDEDESLRGAVGTARCYPTQCVG